MSNNIMGSRVIVALDYPDATSALDFVGKVTPGHCRLKVGKELFTRTGPELVREFVRLGFDVFLDLKFHDIPNTVARACAAGAELGVWMMNVHALGGEKMLVAARESVEKFGADRPVLLAVTVLTSLADKDLPTIGLGGNVADSVSLLANLAQESGIDGVVCSSVETGRLRAELGENFVLVTPGIRPQGASKDDQQRVTTPTQAVKGGSDYLVIGRPVTLADDPVSELLTINSEIDALTR